MAEEAIAWSPRPSGLRPQAPRAHSQGFRLSEAVLLLSLLHSAAARMPAALVQRRSCTPTLGTPPPGRPPYSDAAAGRSPVGGPVPSTLDGVIRSISVGTADS